MAVIFNVVLPILAGVSILAMFYFIWRAFSGRYKAARQPYNVGRQEARHTAQINLVRAVFALILALIFLGVIGVSSQLVESLPAATATPVQRTRPPTSEATIVPTATKITVTSESSPTSPLPTSTAVPLPTVTNTPEPLTATVSSGVGVWLREAPGTETAQLEWLLEGTILIVLADQETVDDLQWQQVQTEEGRTGWVALEFIAISSEP